MRLLDLFKAKKKPQGFPKEKKPQSGKAPGVEVGGSWMNALWSDVPVELPKTLDVPAFFEQDPMPPLLDQDGYRSHYTAPADWSLHWVIALLHHPDESVVLEVVRYWEKNWHRHVETEVKMSYRTLLFDSAADHLLSKNEELACASARLFWRGFSEENWEIVKDILRDPSYPDERGAHDRLAQCRPDDPAGQVAARPSTGNLGAEAWAGAPDEVRRLLEKGVDVDSARDDGMTGLMWAAYKGDIDLLTLLLEKGASVDAKSDRGTTALMMAAQEGNAEAVRVLLAYGSDPRAKDRGGFPALVYARNFDHQEVLRLLTTATSE